MENVNSFASEIVLRWLALKQKIESPNLQQYFITSPNCFGHPLIAFMKVANALEFMRWGGFVSVRMVPVINAVLSRPCKIWLGA